MKVKFPSIVFIRSGIALDYWENSNENHTNSNTAQRDRNKVWTIVCIPNQLNPIERNTILFSYFSFFNHEARTIWIIVIMISIGCATVNALTRDWNGRYREFSFGIQWFQSCKTCSNHLTYFAYLLFDSFFFSCESRDIFPQNLMKNLRFVEMGFVRLFHTVP